MKNLRFSEILRLGLVLSAILYLWFWTNPSFASEYDDMEVLKSDEEGIVFRYVVPELERRKIEVAGKTLDLINIDKCPLSNLPGKPQLPIRRVVIAVPLEAEFSVEILQLEETELPGVDLAFALKGEQDETSPVGYRMVPSKPEEVSDQFYPPDIIALDNPTFLRNQRIIEMEISPLQYNSARKILRVHNRITVKVSYRGGKNATFKSEKDLFEKIYQNVLLNYEESKGWRKSHQERVLLKPSPVYPFGYSDNWYKAIVYENGIYKIDQAMLIQAGISINSLDPRTLRIFSGGGKVLPLYNSDTFLELKEMAIYVSGEEDGTFDAEDFILFYGWSTNDWEYDSTAEAVGFHTNPFTNENTFWLTFGAMSISSDPKRMQIRNGSLVEQNPIVPTKFKSRVHLEQDKITVDYSYWYWMETTSARLFVSLPGALPQDTCLIKLQHTGFTPSLWVNGEPAEVLDSLSLGPLTVARSLAFHGGLVDTLDISFPGNSFFDWYEVEYPRRFECHDRQLLFDSPETPGIVQFNVSNLYSPDAYLFDVTDYYEVKIFQGQQKDGEFARFQDTIDADVKTRYFLVDQSKIMKPAKFFRDDVSHLREVSEPVDFLIITHSDFQEQAQTLQSFRESYNQMSVMVVGVQDVYDEFSGGLFDPVAIRDFLKYAFQNWAGPPAYVLLVGDGNYDYKNNLGTGARNFIPPFTLDPSISDDMYVLFGDTLGMVIGRMPVSSERGMEAVLDKIINYEKDPEFGTWRNLITLVADDQWEGFGVPDGQWDRHTPDTETLAKSHIPAPFNVSKIYLMEYPFDYKGMKPQAEEAVINAFNSGSLIINYMGHGNTNVWAHERAFQRSQDIPRLTNKRKLPLVYQASCSIGLFFSPIGEGLAEELFRAEEKGAVATISATGLVGAWSNAQLNFKVYDLLLNQNSLSVGQALLIAKLLRRLDSNDQKYVLFGDPVMQLGVPQLEVDLVEVSPDTLSALGLINIKGEIKNHLGDPMTGFDGVAKISAFDSERNRIHTMPKGEKVSFDLPGLVMFKGSAEVKGGKFQAGFVVPKDISYGGNTGRISVYLESQNQDGAGVRDSLVIRGSNTTVIDTVGPEIAVSFDDKTTFANGETILPNSTLRLSLFDDNGINITGEVGHGITLTVNEDYQNQIDLTSNFEYDLGDYRRGSLFYQLPGFSEGDHILNLKAWDNANNSSVISANVRVSAQRELELTQVMNYPNPFSEETHFYYHLSQDVDFVQIMIFTLAGRLIRQFPFASSQRGINFSTTWDGKDQEGDEVANGVYIYKIIVETSVNGERKRKEALGKAVVVR